MIRVIVVAEGRTEQTFIRDVLAPSFVHRNVFIEARIVGKPGQKGGVGNYNRARKDILALLKQESGTVITSMFDFYGMPNSWPGRATAAKLSHDEKAATVETAIRKDIVDALGGKLDERRLIPYIQMHEYESLLFSKPSAISEVTRHPEIEGPLQRMRDEFETPEQINDDPDSAPSKRISQLFPYYRKPLHGVFAAKRITVEVMRAECPHFNEWLTTLENLGQAEG